MADKKSMDAKPTSQNNTRNSRRLRAGSRPLNELPTDWFTEDVHPYAARAAATARSRAKHVSMCEDV
jgi:hypothetical protein